ncbi:MAG: hypothetical protein P4M11_11625 [Candidatus Pacebacteria bacterium]|nr:hypothetical protein [Candidatus Paceibacterota bacterium]
MTRKEVKEQIVAKQVTVKKSEIPSGWTLEAADFINKVHTHREITGSVFSGSRAADWG